MSNDRTSNSMDVKREKTVENMDNNITQVEISGFGYKDIVEGITMVYNKETQIITCTIPKDFNFNNETEAILDNNEIVPMWMVSLLRIKEFTQEMKGIN